MREAARAVLVRAPALEPDERAELAAESLSSLDDPTDEDALSAWESEVERPVAAIDARSARTETWATVKRRSENNL